MAISLHRIFWLLTILVSLNVIVVSKRRKPAGEIKWGQDCPHYKPKYFKYPDPVECFRRYSYGTVKDHVGENEYKDKIYGGQPSRIGTWPQFVKLSSGGPSGSYFCGGTILTDQIILTAAHCFLDPDTEYIIVSLSIGYQEFRALGRLQFCPSPLYKSDSYTRGDIENDIAFIILEKRLPLSQANRHRFAPICLPTKRDYFPVNKAVGMGAYNKYQEYPMLPYDLTVFREDQDKCYFRHNKEKFPQYRVGCYLSWHNQPGTACVGDSGSPVFDAIGEQIGLLVAGSLRCDLNATINPFFAVDTCDKRRTILKLADRCYHEVTENFKLPRRKLKLRHDIVLE